MYPTTESGEKKLQDGREGHREREKAEFPEEIPAREVHAADPFEDPWFPICSFHPSSHVRDGNSTLFRLKVHNEKKDRERNLEKRTRQRIVSFWNS